MVARTLVLVHVLVPNNGFRSVETPAGHPTKRLSRRVENIMMSNIAIGASPNKVPLHVTAKIFSVPKEAPLEGCT